MGSIFSVAKSYDNTISSSWVDIEPNSLVILHTYDLSEYLSQDAIER